MHELEINGIVRLITPLFTKFKLCLQIYSHVGVNQFFLRQNIREHIQEGFAIVYRLCLRNIDLFS